MSKVTVIIPLYNGEKTIERTIKSVLEQTFCEFELIVVNDGSTDGSLAIVKKFNDDRIKVFDFENGGPACARNRGLQLARSDFITFMDADDLWTRDKVELQYRCLQNNPDAGIVYSWVYLIDENDELIRYVDPIVHQGNVYKEILVRCFVVCGSNLMMHRKVAEDIGFYNPNFELAQDWEYAIRVAEKWPFVVVPKYQVLYRQHDSSLTSALIKTQTYLLKVIEDSFSRAPENLQYLKRRSIAYNYLHLANKQIDNKNSHWKRKVLKLLLKSAFHFPPRIFSKTYIGIAVKYFLSLTLSPEKNKMMLNYLYRLEVKINDWRPANWR